MSKKNKMDEIRSKMNRKGIILIALLAVLILVINAVTFSYSWFEPQTESGRGLGFENTSHLRSEECEFETFIGEVVTAADKTGSNAEAFKDYYIDQVKYSDVKLLCEPYTDSNNNGVHDAGEAYTDVDENGAYTDTTKVSVPAAVTSGGVTTPGKKYFRTDITNQSSSYSSVISLYIFSMPANLAVAITSPSNTYHFVGTVADMQHDFGQDTWPDYFIIRNAYVKIKDENDADGPGLLRVEWFVENRSSSPVTIDLNGLYLMYN